MGFYSPRVVLNDARRFGLAVRPLDVNLSGEWFEVEDDGRALRVGLAYVKEMSAAARRAIVEARGDGSAAAGGTGVREGASLLPDPPAAILHSPPHPHPPLRGLPWRRATRIPRRHRWEPAGPGSPAAAPPGRTPRWPTSWRARA